MAAVAFDFDSSSYAIQAVDDSGILEEVYRQQVETSLDIVRMAAISMAHKFSIPAHRVFHDRDYLAEHRCRLQ
jgi:hypothetical protein